LVNVIAILGVIAILCVIKNFMSCCCSQ